MEILAKVDWLSVLVAVVNGVVVPLVALALRRWLLDKSSSERLRQVAGAARVVYQAVEALARRTPGEVDDKLAVALGRLADHLGRELTAAERSAAANVFAAEAHADKRRGSVSLADMSCGRTSIS